MEEIKNEKNISQEILTNIKEHKIAPRPRWQFLFKNYFIWTIGFLALFFGAVSISLIIFMLRYNEWSSYSRLGGGPIEFLLLVVPIFWIISLVIFVILIYFNFKKTKHGYRYNHLLIIAAAIILSIILGFGFSALGMGQKIDAMLGRRAPLYDSLINPRLRFWSNPVAGRLSGLVVSKDADDNFVVVDNNNVEWHVNYVESDDEKLAEAKKTGASDDEIYNVVVGRPVRFLGEVAGAQEFKAKELIPFHPGREFFYRLEKGRDIPKAKNIKINKNELISGDSIRPGSTSPESDPSGMVPAVLFEPNVGPKDVKKKMEFYDLLEKYPEFKDAFSKDLLSHKEMIKPLIKKDPEFLRNLESLKIASTTLRELE
ncbi:MAG: hypothetical protein ACYC40_00800 [Patescibacteria group bacterium]